MKTSKSPDAEHIRIGREIRDFVKLHNNGKVVIPEGKKFKGILGQSALDKAFTGRYTDLGLRKLASVGFNPTINSASSILGGYHKDKWSSYIGSYLMIHLAIGYHSFIDASLASVSWDDSETGLVLHKHKTNEFPEKLGAFRIPHERSPTIFIQDPYEIGGVTIIVATMIGEACMRGLLFGVENPSANSYTPIATPIVLKKLQDGSRARRSDIGLISVGHQKFEAYKNDLIRVVERGFCSLPMASG